MLCIAIGDSTLSVRVSSASAAANVADALQQQQQQLDPQMTAPLLELAKGKFRSVCTSLGDCPLHRATIRLKITWESVPGMLVVGRCFRTCSALA